LDDYSFLCHICRTPFGCIPLGSEGQKGSRRIVTDKQTGEKIMAESEHTPTVMKRELAAAVIAIRAELVASGYSSFVTDAQVERWAYNILLAVATARIG
jgi:hypothetical protein